METRTQFKSVIFTTDIFAVQLKIHTLRAKTQIIWMISFYPIFLSQCSSFLLWSKNLTVLVSICSTNHRASWISTGSNRKMVIVTISNWSLISTCHVYTIWSSYFKFLKIWKICTSIYHVICQWSSWQRPAVNHPYRVSGKTHQIIGISSPSTSSKALEIQLIWSLLLKTHFRGSLLAASLTDHIFIFLKIILVSEVKTYNEIKS